MMATIQGHLEKENMDTSNIMSDILSRVIIIGMVMVLLGYVACADSYQDLSLTNNSLNENSILVPISCLKSDDIIVDIGSDPEKYIYGAVHMPFTAFLENNTIKPLPAIAAVIGDAGISRNDSVALYGECLPCGGGPTTATFAYWIMRYAGHEDVKLIDGGYDEWVQAGGKNQDTGSSRKKTAYELHPREDLLANFSYVASGVAQLVDARLARDFLLGTIPGSVNIPYDDVVEGDKIKNESSLQRVFSKVDKNKPVVVYSTTGVKASVVWFALTLMGYDAKLYTFQDWHTNNGRVYLPIKQYIIETEI
jgi:thiosulfate/3-mercaptopyruvate sulfurtransferase